jgi:mono/diheme cytochrome c family protein
LILRSLFLASPEMSKALPIVVCLVVLSGCTGPPPASATGEEIYGQVCANCHGEDLNGGIGPAIGAGSNAAEQDDEFLVLTITRGRGRMPSFDTTLTDDQIARVIAYVRTTHQSEGLG